MTTRFSSRHAASCGALALLAVLVCGSPAHAEPTPSEIESARALYVQGLELRDRGDLAGSTARFQAAQALAATPITTLELGRSLGLQDRLLEAREVLLSVDRIPVRPDESQKATKARAEAGALAEQIRVRIPSVVVKVRFADPRPEAAAPSPPRTPRVTVDGALVPPEALSAPRKLNPGTHTIVAELDGARASADVTLAHAENRTVTLTLTPNERAPLAATPATSTPPVPAAPTPETTDPLEREREAPGAWFYGGAIAAIGGVALGSVTGVVALGKSSTLDEICNGDRCPRTAQNDVSTGQTMATVSTIAFAVAGAGVVLAAVSWLTRGTKPPVRASAFSFPVRFP